MINRKPYKRRPLMERFAERWELNTLTGCWEWKGCPRGDGYGSISLLSRDYLAHRISYEWYVGPIPEGLELDHLCRNRRCVNPDHLEAVTRKVNVERGLGRKREMCPHGHAYDESNTYVHPRTGERWCRQCRREKMRRYNQMKKVA